MGIVAENRVLGLRVLMGLVPAWIEKTVRAR